MFLSRAYTLDASKELIMADRKQFQSDLSVKPELAELLKKARETVVSGEMLREQRVSFAFGNALHSDLITKKSVRASSTNIRLK